jgi:hypothetical protein
MSNLSRALSPDQGPGWTCRELHYQGYRDYVQEWLTGSRPEPLTLIFASPVGPLTMSTVLWQAELRAYLYGWPAPWTEAPFVYVSNVAVTPSGVVFAVGPARTAPADRPWEVR